MANHEAALRKHMQNANGNRLRIEHGLNKHEPSAESAPLSLMLGMQNIRAERALLGSSRRGLDLKKD